MLPASFIPERAAAPFAVGRCTSPMARRPRLPAGLIDPPWTTLRIAHHSGFGTFAATREVKPLAVSDASIGTH